MKIQKRIVIILFLLTLTMLAGSIVKHIYREKLEEYFANEIKELHAFYGIREVSQASSYVNQDVKGYGYDSDRDAVSAINQFQSSVSDKEDGCFRFATKQNGVLYLGYISYKNEGFYAIIYNTRTDEYTLEEYSEVVNEKGTYVDASNLPWKYIDFYLVNPQGKKLYLYTWTHIDYPYLDKTENFVQWVKQYKGQNDIQKMTLDEQSDNFTVEMDVFRKNISEKPSAAYEYRYIFVEDGRQIGICAVFFINDKYYHITYLPGKDWYELHVYDNLYTIQGKDGADIYILSNLEEKATYEKNNIFDENVEDYLFVSPVLTTLWGNLTETVTQTEDAWYVNYSSEELETQINEACTVLKQFDNIDKILSSLQYETLEGGYLKDYYLDGRTYAKVVNFPIEIDGVKVTGYDDIMKMMTDTCTEEYCKFRWHLDEIEKSFLSYQGDMYVVPAYYACMEIDSENPQNIELNGKGFSAVFNADTGKGTFKSKIVFCLTENGWKIDGAVSVAEEKE